MTSSLSLQCLACGGQNAPDSHFCRHCGKALNGTSTASIKPPESTESTEISNDAPKVIEAEAGLSAENGAEHSSVSEEIDERRAKHLLERAHNLAERGDAAGAILACRQSVALAPHAAAGHAMLGHLLERTGDATHAVIAYEKALQFAPDADLEKDIARLRGKMESTPNAAIFHFDDNELFADKSEDSPATESKGTTVIPAAVSGAVVANALGDEDALPNIGAAAPGLPSANPRLQSAGSEAAPNQKSPESVSGAANPANDFSDFLLPISGSGLENEAPLNEVFANSSHTAFQGAKPSPRAVPIIAPAILPIAIGDPAKKPVNLSAFWARPSYYGRSLPLVGATILALGFLSWARNLAVARTTTIPSSVIVAQAPFSPSVAEPLTSGTNENSGAPPALAPVGSAATDNGGFPISNQPVSPVNPAAAPQTNQGTTSNVHANSPVNPPLRPANGPVGNGSRVAGAPRRVTPRFPISIPPATISVVPNNGGNSRSSNSPVRNSNDFTLPAPNIAVPAPAAPPTSVLPSGDSTALNPAGAAGRGYVRITQGRVGSALPQRPGARAGADERAAADAARNGSTERAIDGLTSAINSNAGDAGFRFQQRATLFLQRGDYGRAADDFQAAISAYNEQIGRGEQVSSARAGLRAARSGLNVALAGGR